jgi:cell division protease FtsH
VTDRMNRSSDPTWIAGRVLHVAPQGDDDREGDGGTSGKGASGGDGKGSGRDEPGAKGKDGHGEEKVDLKALFTGKPFPGEEPPTDPNGGRRIPPRTIITYAVIVLLVVFIIAGVVGGRTQSSADELATSDFVNAVNNGRVSEATYKASDYTISGKYWRDDESVGNDDLLVDYTSTYLGTDSLDELMASHPDVKYKADVTRMPAWASTLASMIPMLLFLGVMIWWLNKFQDPNAGAMQFGKTKALTNAATRPKVKFSDVAGCDEAIEELREIKDFLEDPAKFEKLGAKIPRGVLLVGPPGTGKTLLAKAVAGEAGVPFFSISGSDFVEMFVGVGASRVRDLFKNAKEAAPSIIFIDEIDAVGRQRGAGLGGGHDEREQTLNQLLVEMDGFEENTSVIMIAATNRPDILDPALLRPGRFDRQITVDRPDVAGREEILKIHSRNKPLSSDVELDKVAKLTPGFSGADLGNLMNESALLAARRGRDRIGMNEINEAMERVIAGPQRKSRVMTDDERTTIAFHESGHALVGHLLPNADPVHKISIIPRGQALGYTLSLPEEDHFLQTRSAMLDEISVLLGGRTAEELFCKDITSGASNDLERATKIAKAMVTRYGMSEKLGTQVYGEANHEVFLGRDLGEQSNYSPETAHAIDEEVSAIIEAAHERTRKILSEHGDQMRLMASVLLERETVEGKAATALLDDKWDEYLAHEEDDRRAIAEEDAARTAAEHAAPQGGDDGAPEPAEPGEGQAAPEGSARE